LAFETFHTFRGKYGANSYELLRRNGINTLFMIEDTKSNVTVFDDATGVKSA